MQDVRSLSLLDRVLPKPVPPAVSASIVRDALPVIIDIVAWAMAIVIALVLRQDFALSQIAGWSTVLLIGVVTVLQTGLGGWLRLYSRRYVLGSLEEARMLALTTFLTAFVAGLAIVAVGQYAGVPRSIIPIAAPISLLLMAAARYALRLSPTPSPSNSRWSWTSCPPKRRAGRASRRPSSPRRACPPNERPRGCC